MRLIAPHLLPPSRELGVDVFHDMTVGLKDCDIIMMLRLQTERMQSALFLDPRILPLLRSRL